MPTNDSWVSDRLIEAQKRHPLVTESVSIRMRQLLEGPFSERLHSSSELTSVAISFLADIAATGETRGSGEN